MCIACVHRDAVKFHKDGVISHKYNVSPHIVDVRFPYQPCETLHAYVLLEKA